MAHDLTHTLLFAANSCARMIGGRPHQTDHDRPRCYTSLTWLLEDGTVSPCSVENELMGNRCSLFGKARSTLLRLNSMPPPPPLPPSGTPPAAGAAPAPATPPLSPAGIVETPPPPVPLPPPRVDSTPPPPLATPATAGEEEDEA